MNNRFFILLLAWGCFGMAGRLLAQFSPSNYGRVIIDKYSSETDLGPVVFDHWIHRARFTCRLCHVDIGFAMQANGTDIKASTNREGFHCGACHDGKRVFTEAPLFASCVEVAPSSNNELCARCHSLNKPGARKNDYETFTAKFPKTNYGVDWAQAEASGVVKPVDFLEGVSVKRPPLENRQDFSLTPRADWVSNIVFSHKAHSVWNGCEVCHPEIFPTTQKGSIRYTMFDIDAGQYCGVCHGKVAFPIRACEKCHTKPLR